MLNRVSDRVQARLDELYAIGGGRGANRVGYSREEDAAHELAAGWMAEAGLRVERDAAGNLLGRRRPGATAAARGARRGRFRGRSSRCTSSRGRGSRMRACRSAS